MSAEEDARKRHAIEQPLFRDLAREVALVIERRCKVNGVQCLVEHRPKDVAGVIKKMVAQKCSYDDVFDKAGARAVIIYADARDAAVEQVRDAFDITWQCDYSAKLALNVFDYKGFHFQVQLKPDHHEHARLGSSTCELQLHTLGESTWAKVAHDLTYKVKELTDDSMKRSVLRLSALLELVDTEVARVRALVREHPAAAPHRALTCLEKHYFKFTARSFNRSLSIETLTALPLVKELGDKLEPTIDAWVSRNEKKLRFVFDQRANSDDYPMLFQPEALLLLYRRDVDEFLFRSEWPALLPTDWLEMFESIWMPTPSSSVPVST